MSTPAAPITGQNDQASVGDFASKVRAKFPGAYDDLDDLSLSQKVVAKHPQYADMLPKDFGTQPVAPLPPAIAPENKNAPVHFDAQGNRVEPHANVIEQEGARQDERATRQGAAMSRAASSPTPMSNAVNILNPIGAARSVVGAKLLAPVGKAIAPHLGASPEAGEAVAGLIGGLGADERIAPAFNRTRSAAAKSIVAPLTFEGGGEAGADVRSGIDPNRALAHEPGMTGSKKTLVGELGLPGKILDRVSELKEAANQILDNNRFGNSQIDAGAHIDAAIDNAINQAEKIAGGTERLENLRTALRTKYGATQGTPREMNDLASKIQTSASDLGAFRNTQPIEASAASAMRDAARRIRNHVNEIVPEAADLNSRMADLLDAQSGVTHNLNAERGQSILGGEKSGLVSSMLNRTIGSAPVRTRIAQMLTAGKKFGMPEATPTSPAPPVLNRLGMGPTAMPPGTRPAATDAEFRDIKTDLPSSGKTIITPRAGVESVPGAPEVQAGPEPSKQVQDGPEAKQLPPPSQIQVGPSSIREPLLTPPPEGTPPATIARKMLLETNPVTRHPITGAIELGPPSAPPEKPSAPTLKKKPKK